jgi:hypothetical protein
MRRFIISILVAVLTLLPSAQPALGATQGTVCSGTNKILLWENKIFDTSDGNDKYWKCQSFDSNLSTLEDTHVLPGDCHSVLLNSGTWNDCVSSFTIWLDSAHVLCLYSNRFWSGHFLTVKGPRPGWRYNIPSGYGDSLTGYYIGFSCP